MNAIYRGIAYNCEPVRVPYNYRVLGRYRGLLARFCSDQRGSRIPSLSACQKCRAWLQERAEEPKRIPVFAQSLEPSLPPTR